MAELLLRSHTNSTYEVGDVMHAFNDRRIGAVHIEHICDVRKTGFNSDGLRPVSISKQQRDLSYQYLFERVNATTVQRTDQFTNEVDIIDATPNAKGEYMNVALFLKRRLENPNHAIFGTAGNEYWYGGKVLNDVAKVDEVWNLIEGETPERRVNHKKWPLGSAETLRFVALSTADFDDSLAQVYEQPLSYDEYDQTVMKRACYVDVYEREEFASAIKDSIANPNEHIDVRDYAEFIPEEIVQFRGL